MKAEFDFQDITKVGLPDINDENTSVLFLWDGNLVNGWPISDMAPGEAIPLDALATIAWEGSDFQHTRGGAVAGVRYWSYIPHAVEQLSLPDKETTWMYHDERTRALFYGDQSSLPEEERVTQ